MKRRSIGNQRRHRKKKQEKKKTKLRAHTTYMFVSFVSIRASTDDFYLLASRCYWHGSYTRIIHCTTDHLAHLILCLYCYMFVAYIYYIWWDQRFLSLFISSSGFVFLVEVFFLFCFSFGSFIAHLNVISVCIFGYIMIASSYMHMLSVSRKYTQIDKIRLIYLFIF